MVTPQRVNAVMNSKLPNLPFCSTGNPIILTIRLNANEKVIIVKDDAPILPVTFADKNPNKIVKGPSINAIPAPGPGK